MVVSPVGWAAAGPGGWPQVVVLLHRAANGPPVNQGAIGVTGGGCGLDAIALTPSENAPRLDLDIGPVQYELLGGGAIRAVIGS